MTQVKCYGCGGRYDAANEAESTRHTHHLGDSGLSREKLLEMVNELQAERDAAVAEASRMAVASQ